MQESDVDAKKFCGKDTGLEEKKKEPWYKDDLRRIDLLLSTITALR